ncbi:MAG: hypothetical protein JST81_13335 [Bacteroidetes bacterium]|nr:hypothetical protein [Bacteroidota bacterium]
MEGHYKTLQTIYTITEEDPNPETYKCRPREIILRQYQSWTTIEKHLRMLKDEGLITIMQEDTVVIFITKEGIKKINEEKKLNWKMDL